MLTFLLLILFSFAHPAIDELQYADSLYRLGSLELEHGDEAQAHVWLLEAADIYRRHDHPAYLAHCYYHLATAYMNQRDVEKLTLLTDTLRSLNHRYPNLPAVQYDYYSILSTLHMCHYEQTADPADLDRMIFASKASAFYMEQMTIDEWRRETINPIWAYYNIAVTYDLYFSPPQTDSIEKYLNEARRVNNLEYRPTVQRQEGDISIRDEQAWLYYYKGDYRAAEEEMRQVLALIDTVEQLHPNTVVTERGEAYAFMVELAETEGRIDDALEWQKLLTENNNLRYSIEKNRALHEVEAKYELTQKELQIQALHRRYMSLIIGFIAILLLLLLALLALWLYHKNREQERYEEAVNSALTERMQQTGWQTLLDQLKEDFPTAADKLGTVNLLLAEQLAATALVPLSLVDRRYLCCFLAQLPVQEIADLFHVEPASVYTVRYRLRKKFPAATLPF